MEAPKPHHSIVQQPTKVCVTCGYACPITSFRMKGGRQVGRREECSKCDDKTIRDAPTRKQLHAAERVERSFDHFTHRIDSLHSTMVDLRGAISDMHVKHLALVARVDALALATYTALETMNSDIDAIQSHLGIPPK